VAARWVATARPMPDAIDLLGMGGLGRDEVLTAAGDDGYFSRHHVGDENMSIVMLRLKKL
jgi:hypothetical protein